MTLLRASCITAVLLSSVLSGCGLLDKLKGAKDSGVAADDEAGAVVAAQTPDASDDAGDGAVAVAPSAPIIGACKPNDLADCTNKCQNLKNQGSCVNLGIMFANGTGVAKDTGKAATLFQGACNGGVASGCDHFGLALLTGQGIQTDQPRAADTFKKGCD